MKTLAVLSETIVLFADARKLKGKPHWWDLRNWARYGLVSKFTGEKITLEWAVYGGKRCTSVEAFDRFLKKLNGA